MKETAAVASTTDAKKVVKVKDGVAMKIPKEGEDMSVSLSPYAWKAAVERVADGTTAVYLHQDRRMYLLHLRCRM